MATTQLRTLLRHIEQLTAGREVHAETDQQLLDDFAARRDEAAFASLVSRHGPMVLRVCRRVLHHEQDAEDAFQATFLVLAQRTASINKRDSLGSWLHGVAYRTAMNAKRTAARRRNHEARLRAVAPQPAAGPTWDETQAVLDEEILRLPSCFREAFVLCVLEGKSGSEAAVALGCKEGTVKSRVKRARRLLQVRLARRGIKLTALLAALSVAESAARSALPATLARATVRFGLLYAAGETAAGTIPAHVAALAAGVTRAMFLTKAKIATAVLMTVSLLIAGGTQAYQRLAAQEKDAPPATAKKAEPSAPKAPIQRQAARVEDPKDSATFSGRVLDPNGKPFAGAKLHLIAHPWAKPEPVHLQTASAAGGAFRLTVAPRDARRLADDSSWRPTAVVATADGYGPAVSVHPASESAADLTLQLAKDDVPIRGRILDLEGKPIAGVTVHVAGLSVPAKGDLTAWLTALEANKKDGYAVEGKHLQRVYFGCDLRFDPAKDLQLYPGVVTDSEGRFEMKGVGRERIVNLVLEGPTIAHGRVSVYTRPGNAIHATMFANNPDGGQLHYYGATFEHLATPSRPIVGVVRDKDTGKPLAGVTIQSDKFAGVNCSGDANVRTVTDKGGRYRLIGMPKGKGNVIKAAPAPGQPYLQSEHEVEDRLGLEPVTVDFGLKRGVMIKGRVLDKVTRQPVYANVQYRVFLDNPNRREALHWTIDRYLQTEDDGTFEVVGFPGRGLIVARSWGDHYRMGIGVERIEGKDTRNKDVTFLLTAPGLCETNTFHTYLEVNPAKGAESVTCELVLDPGTMPHGTVVGPDGKPLPGAKALGLTAYNTHRNWTRAPLKTAEFTVWGLGPADEREVEFVQEAKQLTATMRVRGDAKEPLIVKLGPKAP
jgi:RNA polymerase sigma factor (sigma-70 family)